MPFSLNLFNTFNRLSILLYIYERYAEAVKLEAE